MLQATIWWRPRVSISHGLGIPPGRDRRTDRQTDRIPIANTRSQQYLPVQLSRVKTKRSTFSANRHGHVLRMSGSRESSSFRLQAGTSERRPRSDYYLYSVYARLFGRIRIHYSAYYSGRIEYSVQPYCLPVSVRLFGATLMNCDHPIAIWNFITWLISPVSQLSEFERFSARETFWNLGLNRGLLVVYGKLAFLNDKSQYLRNGERYMAKVTIDH